MLLKNIYSFEELKNELDEKGKLLCVVNNEGIYKVYLPEKLKLQIREETDAINVLSKKNGKNTNLLYDVKMLEKKWNTIISGEFSGERLLYIGMASNSKTGGLRRRITQFVRYGYKESNNHIGGRAIWQLENSKKLLIEIITCNNAKEIEKEEIKKYKREHGEYPFANWRS